MTTTPHTLIIGAGIGGLTAGALLLKAGHRVTVLEAHVYPGGSAGTFYHKKYRFDAGATLAGGWYADGMPFVVAFIGDLRSDAALLGYAYDLEQATRARAAPALDAR
jgi:phytoene dehydrogenase-like protein